MRINNRASISLPYESPWEEELLTKVIKDAFEI